MLGHGPWIFKASGDGIAKEVATKRVRPNTTYFILHSENDTPTIPGATDIQLECQGINAKILEVGPALTEELLAALEAYGIQPAREIRVTPAGAIPARWDGEGSVEWLSTDTPFVAVETNYSVAHYEFELTFGDQVLSTLTTGNAIVDTPTFIKLPKFEAGFYSFNVNAVPLGEGRVEQGRLDISIRDPARLSDTLDARGALLLTVYPPAPTLEQLWEGVTALEVLGPRTRQISCTLGLLEKGGRDTLFQDQCSLKLPFSSRDWMQVLEDRWQRNERCMFAYGAADSCELTFDGGELGRQYLFCERSLSPLRWAFQRQHDAYAIRLIDDTEAYGDRSVTRYAFEHPDIGIQLDADHCCASAEVAEPGLYVAVSGEQKSTLVVPHEVTRLEQFKLAPKIKRPDASVSGALHLLALVEHWADARLANTLIAGRFRNRVVEVFIRELFRLSGGYRWHRAERSRINRGGDDWIAGMADAIPSRIHGKGWAETILSKLPRLAKNSSAERVEFLATLTGQSRRLCEFTLRLASAPATACSFAGGQLDFMLRELRRLTTVARIARFFCLVITDHLDAQTSLGGNPYPGWQWD